MATTQPPQTIGVAGAGTMGAGIAQLACLSGARTLLHDPVPEALRRGIDTIHRQLDRGVERGRLQRADADAAKARLTAAPTPQDLGPCELVIEAAPESLQIKQQLFSRLADEVVTEACVLATNTSSLLVTAIASAVKHPERVVGMHFFNPAPVMRLLEVVAGMESSGGALATARAAGEAMGKHVIDAVDGPGFLVNRCNRPFGLEALKLLQEQIAPLQQIDRICRMGGGFRMGPFELMDLVGVDVGLDVSRSFHEQSFGEPRWRPSPITVRTVAAGRLGRKSGRGYYDYTDGEHRPPDPEAPPIGGGDGLVVIAGDSLLADELRSIGAGSRLVGGGPRGRARPRTAAADPRPEPARRGVRGAAPGCSAGDLLRSRFAQRAGSRRRGGRVSRAPAVRGSAGCRIDARTGQLGLGGASRRAILRDARQAEGMGGRCARVGARTDRLPGRQ